MSVAKLECPACGLMLTTPDPVPAGTLVNCPKCGTCFGVPALQTRSDPPAVAVARPVGPTVPPVARAVAVPTNAANGDLDFDGMETSSSSGRTIKAARKAADKKRGELPGPRKGRKKNDNTALVWSLAAAAVVLVGGAGVAVVKYAGGSEPKARAVKSPGKDAAKHADKKDNPPPAEAPKPEKPPAPKKDKAAKATAKKPTAADTPKKPGEAMPEKESADPLPIPGLPGSAEEKTPAKK